jgi:hypothetical protein
LYADTLLTRFLSAFGFLFSLLLFCAFDMATLSVGGSYSARKALAAGVRSIGEFVVVGGQAQHYRSRINVLHRIGKCARFSGASPPMFGVIVGCRHNGFIKQGGTRAVGSKTV